MLSFHLTKLGEEQIKSKVLRKKKKIRTEINKIEDKKINRENVTKSQFLKKVNKVNKSLDRLTKGKRKKRLGDILAHHKFYFSISGYNYHVAAWQSKLMEVKGYVRETKL